MYTTSKFTTQLDAIRIAFFISMFILSLVLHIVSLIIFNSV